MYLFHVLLAIDKVVLRVGPNLHVQVSHLVELLLGKNMITELK